MAIRRTKTEILTKAAIGYLVKKGYGVNLELGIVPWGKRKVDVIGINMKGHIIVFEVKSCKSDYTTDKKWHVYLDYCNQFYLVVTESTWKAIEHLVTDKRVGVLVLSSVSGYLQVVRNSPKRELDSDIYKNLILRLAWRNATYSKRNTRRLRVFLDEKI